MADAHLFLCLCNGHYAISTDKSGNNLPGSECQSGWKLVQVLAAAEVEEHVARSLREQGFHVDRPVDTEGGAPATPSEQRKVAPD